MPGKSKTTWQRGRRNRHCHMVWIWDFFSSVAFFALLSSFLSSRWGGKKKHRKIWEASSLDLYCSLSQELKRSGGGITSASDQAGILFISFFASSVIRKQLPYLLSSSYWIVFCLKTLSTFRRKLISKTETKMHLQTDHKYKCSLQL